MAENTAAPEAPAATGAPSAEGVPAETGQPNGNGTEAAPKPDLTAQLQAERERAAGLEATARSATEQLEATKKYIIGLASEMTRQREAPPEEDEAQLVERLQTQPKAALDQAVSERLAPVMRDLYTAQSAQARMQGEVLARKAGLGEEWDAYAKDMDTFMSGVALELQARPETWVDALNLQVARHIPQLKQKWSKAQQAAEEQSALEGASGPAAKSRIPRGLNEVEKRVARDLNITEAEFLKHRKEMFGE